MTSGYVYVYMYIIHRAYATQGRVKGAEASRALQNAVSAGIGNFFSMRLASSPGHSQLFKVASWEWPGDEATQMVLANV